jgi:hypothetical protein
MNKEKIKEIINQYQSTGRIAFYHPRKKTISLNGGRQLPEQEAIKIMLECLNKENPAYYQYRKNFFCS